MPDETLTQPNTLYAPDAGLAEPMSYRSDGPLAPCTELAPFDRDERIWWAFRCGTKRSLKQNENEALERLLTKVEQWSLSDIKNFVSAYQLGVVVGGAEAAHRYYVDMIAFVRGLLKPAAEFFDAAYDPEMYQRMGRFYAARAGTPEQDDALGSIGEYVTEQYPALAEGIRALVMVNLSMRALKQWLGSDVNAPTTLAIAVSKELGRVLGEESATLLASADSPATLGGEMGRLLGSACVEVALLIFGY